MHHELVGGMWSMWSGIKASYLLYLALIQELELDAPAAVQQALREQ